MLNTERGMLIQHIARANGMLEGAKAVTSINPKNRDLLEIFESIQENIREALKILIKKSDEKEGS